jgi:hypothetical protein
MKDWQSQTALIGGFIQPHQAPSRLGTVANRHAVALPQGGKDSSLNVYR